MTTNVEALKAALKPFADAAKGLDPTDEDGWLMWEHPQANCVNVGDFRRAAEAYAALEASALSTEDGFVRVPREPTEVMMDAALAAWIASYPPYPEWKQPTSGDIVQSVYRAMTAAAPAPASNGEAVVKETSILAEEDGIQVGILIDLPNGAQVWSGDVSRSLFNEQGEIAMDSLGGNDSGVFVMSSNNMNTEIVCRAASVDHGIAIARALARAALSAINKTGGE